MGSARTPNALNSCAWPSIRISKSSPARELVLAHLSRQPRGHDRDDMHVSGLFMLRGQGLQIIEAAYAGRAPAGPELKVDGLACVVGKLMRFSVRILELDMAPAVLAGLLIALGSRAGLGHGVVFRGGIGFHIVHPLVGGLFLRGVIHGGGARGKIVHLGEVV